MLVIRDCAHYITVKIQHTSIYHRYLAAVFIHVSLSPRALYIQLSEYNVV